MKKQAPALLRKMGGLIPLCPQVSQVRAKPHWEKHSVQAQLNDSLSLHKVGLNSIEVAVSLQPGLDKHGDPYHYTVQWYTRNCSVAKSQSTHLYVHVCIYSYELPQLPGKEGKGWATAAWCSAISVTGSAFPL